MTIFEKRSLVWRGLFSNGAMKHFSMNTYGVWGVNVYLQLFLISALDGSEWAALPAAASPFEKEPPVHFGMRPDETQSQSGLCKEKKSCLSAWKLTPISRSSSTYSSHNTDWAMSVVRWGGNDLMFFNMESWNFRKFPTFLSLVNYVHCEKKILCNATCSFTFQFWQR